MIKQEIHNIKGIQRDLTVSKFNPEFAFDAQNIRLTARENNTLLSVTNEKGNKEIAIKNTNGEPVTLNGTCIGYNILNNYLTLFTTDNSTDTIYRLEKKEGYFECVTLYTGKLNLNTSHPIETLSVYENENIQKVYWIDGINQARVINITAPDNIRLSWEGTSFDFVQELNLEEEVSIERDTNTAGLFAPGVIQYAFTYYNLYGQESNIFYSTPLQYISFDNRGASPEEKVSNSFTITIKNPDPKFDYVRIYSIHRTSIDATPTVLNVTDLAINGSNSLIYTDNGTTGVTIDPTELLYIGGESITPKTMAQKDNTLFLGNILLNNKIVPESLRNKLNNQTINFKTEEEPEDYELKGYYSYKNTLGNPSKSRGFKYLEWYRFGIQFQNKTGKWSEAVFINDAYNQFKTPSPTSKVSASYTIPTEIINEAVQQGFIRARGVVVYPSYTDREVIAQGILCPTVYNLEDRYSNSPFAQASWFTRPFTGVDGESYILEDNGNYQWYNCAHKYNNQYFDIVNLGAWAEFRHNYPIPDNWKRNAEIQCLAHVPDTPYVTDTQDNSIISWVASHKEYYFVDQSIVTMHSPDIEFDDALSNLDISGVKLRIIGKVVYTANASSIDIQTSTPQNDVDLPGFYEENVGVENDSKYGVKSLVSGLNYIDKVYGEHSKGDVHEAAFMIYPWHRNGSLNNQPTLTSEDKTTTRTAMLSHNRRSNLKFAGHTYFLQQYSIWKAYVEGDNNHTGISGVVVFNSDEQSLVRLPAPENSGLGDINYYGNIDKVITPTRDDEEYEFKFDIGAGWDYDTNEDGTSEVAKKYPLNKSKGYPIVGGIDLTIEKSNFHKSFVSTPVPLWVMEDKWASIGKYHKVVENERDAYGTDPVSLKYKSNIHAVIALNYTKDKKQVVLPTMNYSGLGSHGVNYAGVNFSKQRMPWDTSCIGVYQDILPDNPLNNVTYGYSWLAELYRDDITEDTRFGGKTEEAFANNSWLPAGEPTLLINGYDSSTGNPIAKSDPIELEYTEGDTFFQRYDCLKTYPYTSEDQNSVVEIASFMCETRINIDGRYDKNRGQTDNLYMTPSNFNLINHVYSQRNNFFNYRALNYSKYSLDYFPNTVTWTKEKQAGASVDTWTNITLASTLDLDGDKGEVISLNTFNNEIFCFQKQGLSNILFNSRVQIPTSDGTPIEITNGLKVSGKRYISNTIGCNNKWSIAETPSGLYFIDNITNSIYLFNGQVESLSDKLGFRQWTSENNSNKEWNPIEFGNFVTFYDKNNNDVYFVNKETALVYSELLGQFVSFMSYGNVPAMFNISSDFYAFYNGKLWEQFAGDYNMFFGEYHPYSITFISNSDEPYDKIFNTVEFRADCWNDNIIVSGETFDTLEVWNEYQKGITTLTSINSRPSSLKKKFRIWRANVPRANTEWNGVQANKMDRIRNPWAYIKLSMNTENTYRMQFHDMIVHYFI